MKQRIELEFVNTRELIPIMEEIQRHIRRQRMIQRLFSAAQIILLIATIIVCLLALAGAQ